jgi:hypothetical protein
MWIFIEMIRVRDDPPPIRRSTTMTESTRSLIERLEELVNLGSDDTDSWAGLVALSTAVIGSIAYLEGKAEAVAEIAAHYKRRCEELERGEAVPVPLVGAPKR